MRRGSRVVLARTSNPTSLSRFLNPESSGAEQPIVRDVDTAGRRVFTRQKKERTMSKIIAAAVAALFVIGPAGAMAQNTPQD